MAQRIDRSDILAILALLISFVTMGISIYETRILKEDQQIMRSEQKAAVWPYIEKDFVIQFLEDKSVLKLAVRNKGVGPALIDGIHMFYQDTLISNDYLGASDFFGNFFKEEALQNFAWGVPGNKVLSPGEEITLIQIEADRYPGDIQKIRGVYGLRVYICYSSIYQDHWVLKSDADGPEATESCPY